MAVPRSKIAWTDYSGGDANFVLRGRAAGDCEVSPGCANCYAGAILRRSGATGEHTTWNFDKLMRLGRAKFRPLSQAYRRGPGSRPLVFVCDMGDLFHEKVSDRQIVMSLQVMADRADVDWQVLTKRSERMASIAILSGWPENVWAGVTVENQKAADERIPYLIQVPAKVRFISCEPLLELVDLVAVPGVGSKVFWISCGVNWVIVGGESGPRRRTFDVTWARALSEQCWAADVAFFYKQGSALRPGQDDLLYGTTWKQFPEAPCVKCST